MKRKVIFSIFIIIFSISLCFIPDNDQVDAFSNQVIQQGAVGDDVIELQSRLQYLGFYNGKIDGVFGWRTYWALRNFQYEFGMKVDGLAGSKTKAKLANASKYNEQHVKENINKGNKFTHYGGTDLSKQEAPDKQPPAKQAPAKQRPAKQPPAKQAPAKQRPAKQPPANKAPSPAPAPTPAKPAPSPAPAPAKPAPSPAPKGPTAINVPNGYSQNDIQLMANAVHGEARGEPYIGQVAVAAVILNRVDHPSFPNSVSGVIFEPRAFTAVADGQIWLTPNETSKKAVLDAINGWDPTGGAIYYFNPHTATSSWIWGRPQIKQIGKHIFCK